MAATAALTLSTAPPVEAKLAPEPCRRRRLAVAASTSAAIVGTPTQSSATPRSFSPTGRNPAGDRCGSVKRPHPPPAARRPCGSSRRRHRGPGRRRARPDSHDFWRGLHDPLGPFRAPIVLAKSAVPYLSTATDSPVLSRSDDDFCARVRVAVPVAWSINPATPQLRRPAYRIEGDDSYCLSRPSPPGRRATDSARQEHPQPTSRLADARDRRSARSAPRGPAGCPRRPTLGVPAETGQR